MSLFGNIFTQARIASTKLFGKSRAVLANIERKVQGGETEASPDEPFFGTLGVYGRPDEPSDAGECEVLAARTMDGMMPIAYRDLRLNVRVNPKVGEVGLAHYGGGYLSLAWDSAHAGTVVSLSAPHLDSSGAVDEAHYLSMDPSDAGNSVSLAHRKGHGLFLTKDGAAKLMSPDGKKWVEVSDTDGVTVCSDKGMAFGGGIIAGSTNLAEPVALAQAYADLLTDLLTALATTFAAPTVAPGAPLSAAWATAQIPILQARLTALATLGRSQTLKASPT